MARISRPSAVKGNRLFHNPLLRLLHGVKLEAFVLVFTFSFIFSLKLTILLLWGWYGPDLAYPALEYSPAGQYLKSTGKDSDGDNLPDVIELAPEGTPIFTDKGERVGWGTGTDPLRADTDGDFFPDGLENSIGTDPNNWFNPGIIWVFWTLVIAGIIYIVFIRKPDRLKEYIINEEQISGAKVSRTQKYAYSSRRIQSANRSPEAFNKFRSSLASDYFLNDEETALGYAMMKKRQYKSAFQGFMIAAVLLIMWSLIGTTGLIIRSKYEVGKIDQLMDALVKLGLGVVSGLASFMFYRKYKSADRRSKYILKENPYLN